MRQALKNAAIELKKAAKGNTVRVISHLDADGLTSAAIMADALSSLDFSFVLTIVKQLSEEVLLELKKEKYSTYVFCDLGSGQYSLIKEHLGDKKIFILDHHEFDEFDGRAVMVNPHMFGVDGSKEISGSGVCFLFACELDPSNKKNAHLAIIGALGDVQEDRGFTGLNKDIPNTAVENNVITVTKVLRCFGLE